MDDQMHTGAAEIDTEAERRWNLARRHDLANRFGIVLTVPVHGQDELGNWRYGIGKTIAGFENAETVAEFTEEARQIVTESAASLVANAVMAEDGLKTIETHHYETGPAAGSWPQIFVDLQEQLIPALTTGATLLTLAYFFRDVASGLIHWRKSKETDLERQLGEAYSLASPDDYTPRMGLTCPAIVALCYGDFVSKYGSREDLRIDVLGNVPRSV